jgi:prepilin-type N-terminal cleavage/methylation domain-containing protein/prepilin-type processing-associated H-X9-DG protein
MLAYLFIGSFYFLFRRRRSADRFHLERPQRASAFTLIELLVTIAIISILATLLTSGLSSAKWSSRNLVCKNNTRQIGMALHLYALDHSCYPAYGAEPTYQFGDPGYPWFMRLEGYLPWLWTDNKYSGWRNLPRGTRNTDVMPGVYFCPFQKGAMFTDLGGKTRLSIIIGSYGINRSGIGFWRGGKAYQLGLGIGGTEPLNKAPYIGEYQKATLESAIVAPSDFVALGDSFARSFKADMDGDQSTYWDCGYSSLTAGRPLYNPKTNLTFKAHRGRFNFVFGDLHVEKMDMRRQFVPDESNMARWNRDHDPHRALWHEP